MSRGDRPRGVLLIGHGTRDDVGTAQFFQLGQEVAARLNPTPLEPALLEFQPPTISQAWDALVARGVEHVDVAPLLLFAAGHAKQDIPQIIAGCQRRTPDVSAAQARPISRHPSIIELVVRRLSETLRQFETPAERVAVVMVGRGSHDSCAQADMRVLAEVVGRRVAVAATVTAFYAMASPRLPDVLDQVASSRNFDAVAVYAHLLFEGRLYDSIQSQTQESAQQHPGVKMCVAGYLGPHPLVAKAIAERVEQARGAVG